MYDINLRKFFKEEKKFFSIFIVGGWMVAIVVSFLLFVGFESNNTLGTIFVKGCMIFMAACPLYLGYSQYFRIVKRINQVKKLNKTGKLVKNVPYKFEETNKFIGGNAVLTPVVEWTLPNGNVIKLKGDDRFDQKHRDYDGYIDLIMDENDPTNCFMDYDINRKYGNLDSDYFNGVKFPEPVLEIEGERSGEIEGVKPGEEETFYENYEDKKEE